MQKLKYVLTIELIAFLLFMVLFVTGAIGQGLKVSGNQRFLVTKDGKPFFFLGDTAWELFHRLNRQEAEKYLENRAAKGFTVIQAVVLAELDGLKDPNPYGEVPLFDMDPSRPNEKYFEHVDYIVNKAESLGLYIGMLPTWGDKFNLRWGKGPEVFTPANAFDFGKYLGKRYRDKPIIWILGGDRSPENEEDLEIIESMARGLKEGDQGTNLMTYHPMGGQNSSEWFHEKEWLDFNFFQSGHGPKNAPNYEFTIKNLGMKPVKPTMDGEPRYEDHPVQFKPAEHGWFDDFDVRQAGWWSMFSGSFGHTYGNHNIWQMWQEGRQAISMARTNWRRALDHSGAFQVGYMKIFFESYPWQQLLPDQSLILNPNSPGGEYQMAMLTNDKKLLIAYTPYGKPLKIDISKMDCDQIRARWYNPRDDQYLELGAYKRDHDEEFTPHSVGRGSDWILVLDGR